MFGPVFGGHLEPVDSLVHAAFGGLAWRHALAYIPAQVAGCMPERSSPDPKGRPIEGVSATRDEIAGRVAALVDELDTP